MPNSVQILIVDPFADERVMYAEFLRFKGFAVRVCRNAAAALEFAIRQPVHAVITRIMQSGPLDGIELTRSLKQHEKTRSVPVVIITTHIQAHVRKAAEQAGCDCFLVLPCHPDQLLSELLRVSEHFGGRIRAAQGSLR